DPVWGSGSSPGIPEGRAPASHSQSWLASLAWWHLSDRSLPTYTRSVSRDKNIISTKSCQEKMSHRPAPLLHCATKVDLRMSGREATAMDASRRTRGAMPGAAVTVHAPQL